MAATTGAFTATGQSAAFTPNASTNPGDAGAFNVSLWGSFSASVQLERSFDNGLNWHAMTVAGTQIGVWSAAASEVFEEPETGVLYRLNCTSYVSGTLNYRVSQ